MSAAHAASVSTGPRTPVGKAISSQNARKHGLTSASPFIPEDRREAYDALESDLRNELEPIGTSQELAFRTVLANAWNLLRIEKMEAEAQDLDQLLKLQRYRTAAERGAQRARNELAKQQTDQYIQEQLPLPAPGVPPLADPREIAKRTHARPYSEDLQRRVDAIVDRIVAHRDAQKPAA